MMRQHCVYSLADKSVAPVVSLKLQQEDAEQRPGLSSPSLFVFQTPVHELVPSATR